MVQNYTSLLVSDTDGWHDGDGIITYSFIGTVMPNYYPTVDTNGDGEADSWDVGQGDLVPFTGQDFSMNVQEREMTSMAIRAWNEIANVNLQPGTIDPEDPDNPTPPHGTPITGNGALQPVGGTPVPTNDDGYTAYDFSSVFENGFNFFGQHYDASNIFVNTNGNITFNGGLSQYTPTGISAGTRADRTFLGRCGHPRRIADPGQRRSQCRRGHDHLGKRRLLQHASGSQQFVPVAAL